MAIYKINILDLVSVSSGVEGNFTSVVSPHTTSHRVRCVAAWTLIPEATTLSLSNHLDFIWMQHIQNARRTWPVLLVLKASSLGYIID